MRVARLIRCDRIASDYRGFWYRRGTRGSSPVRSLDRIRRLEPRRPARQEVQRLCGLRARLCHVDVDRQARIGCELEAVVVEAEVADDRVVQVLDAGVVEAHVVRGPQCAELVALGRELAYEVREVAAVRIARGLGAEHGDGLAGGPVPVGVELACARVEEDE